MIHAYSDLYLADAQSLLGAMLDVAINEWNQNLTVFYNSFLESMESIRIAHGDAAALSGQSGVELALKVIDKEMPVHALAVNRSPEYWAGWALAYYQWYTGVSFQVLNEEVPIEIVVEMYNPYHEMDIMSFVEKISSLRQAQRVDSYLKIYRKKMGMTQQELADETDIPLKTIQQYEQRQKNINKSQSEYIIKIAKALCCRPEDLME